jgi:hypothetical protein
MCVFVVGVDLVVLGALRDSIVMRRVWGGHTPRWMGHDGCEERGMGRRAVTTEKKISWLQLQVSSTEQQVARSHVCEYIYHVFSISTSSEPPKSSYDYGSSIKCGVSYFDPPVVRSLIINDPVRASLRSTHHIFTCSCGRHSLPQCSHRT